MRVSDLFINENITIKDALKKLDQTAKKILVVTTDENVLKGIVTDGDIRRWILKNGDLSEQVKQIMNTSPISIKEEELISAKKILKEKRIEAIPIVNYRNQVIDIIFWHEEFSSNIKYYPALDNPVVIMAGGKGTRLRPFTNILPKPLIPIGDTPIVERIINQFNQFGCNDFYLTINYMKNMIKAYFDEKEKNYTVNYIEEDKPLGTGGSLHLLKGRIDKTFFVSNCDILIEGNYAEMMKYHKENKNKITLISSLKHYTIPYGIIEINDDSTVKKMVEKPEYDYLVNTGMYILEPECLNDIPENKFYHITELVNEYIERGEKVGVFPVSENAWLDMGQFKEMEKMLEKLGVKQ